MDKWATVVIDVNSVVNQFTSTPESGNTPTQTPFPNLEAPGSTSVARKYQAVISPSNTYTYTTNTTTGMETTWENSDFSHDNASQFWAQFSMTDESNNTDGLQDWN